MGKYLGLINSTCSNSAANMGLFDKYVLKKRDWIIPFHAAQEIPMMSEQGKGWRIGAFAR